MRAGFLKALSLPSSAAAVYAIPVRRALLKLNVTSHISASQRCARARQCTCACACDHLKHWSKPTASVIYEKMLSIRRHLVVLVYNVTITKEYWRRALCRQTMIFQCNFLFIPISRKNRFVSFLSRLDMFSGVMGKDRLGKKK